MRSIFIAVLVFIFLPSIVFASSMSDMFGFWISETALPGAGKKEALIIKHDSFQEGRQPPIECTFSQNDDDIIINFVGPFGDKLEYIVNVQGDKLLLGFSNDAGKRVQQSYIRISKEEAQPYLK